MKIKMKVVVRYKPRGVSRADLEDRLLDVVRRASGDGLLTGYTDAEVKVWDAKIVKKDEITGQHVGHASSQELVKGWEPVAAALKDQTDSHKDRTVG